MIELLSFAERRLGCLEGATSTLPNPDLFVSMFVRKEAVLSSQIEGTQASLVDVLAYEVSAGRAASSTDAAEVLNYVRAMNLGLERLKTLPLSLRLIREIHEKLLEGVRGGERSPGDFRRSQNWIGPAGCTLKTAAYVPPPVSEMMQALHDLEAFLHSREKLHFPPLIHCALLHSQFETIHPFLDGNGRIGRLLITFLLCQERVISRPLLYLSYFFKRHRQEYYERLQSVRDTGDWEGWILFFLRGVSETSEEATVTARNVLAMQVDHRKLIQSKLRTANALRLHDHLFLNPVISVSGAARLLDISFTGANRIMDALVKLRLLTQTPERKRDRLFTYRPYLDLLARGTEPQRAPATSGGSAG